MVKGHSKNDFAAADICLKKSYLWNYVHHMELTENKRCTDTEFSKFLLQVGNNSVPDSIQHPQKKHIKFIPVPESMASKAKDLDEFITEMFPNINQFDHTKPVSILTPRNKNMRLINEKCLEKFRSLRYPTSYSIDSARVLSTDTELNIPMETLNNLHPSGTPPHALEFKKSAPYVCLKNLNLKAGLSNGTRLELIGKSTYLLHVKIMHTGETAYIPRIINIERDTFGFEIRRKQFPVQLAYAMSINKAQVLFLFFIFFSIKLPKYSNSIHITHLLFHPYFVCEGQTLDACGLYLPQEVFTHGQLYVALSRVRTRDSIKIFKNEDEELWNYTDKFYVQNIVFHYVLPS